MEFSVSSQTLLEGLQKAVSVIPTKTSLPILGNILFQVDKGNLTLHATDLEVSIATQVPVTVKSSGSVALPGKIVHDLVRQLRLLRGGPGLFEVLDPPGVLVRLILDVLHGRRE